MPRSNLTNIVRLAVGATAAVFAVASSPAPVHAAAAKPGPGVLVVQYDVAGSTTIARSGFDVPLGPSVLTGNLRQDGSFRAGLPLPRQTVSFQAPNGATVKSDVLFRQVGMAKGALVPGAGGTLSVNATATYQVLLRKVLVNGKAQHVGRSCRTTTPFTATVVTPAGQVFSIDEGGPLDGTYTLPAFQNCGAAATPLINALVPGPGNNLHLVLSGGRIQE